MMQTSPESESTIVQWLDASVRQRVVELALAGAHHGMKTEARTILDALPSLVPEQETRQWLHVALLIALGDTTAARVCLAQALPAEQGDVSAANAFAHWLTATEKSQVRRSRYPLRRAASSDLASPTHVRALPANASAPSDTAGTSAPPDPSSSSSPV